MSTYICICFDHEATGQIAAMQRRLEMGGVSDYARRVGYPPHLTLLGVDEDQETDKIVSSAKAFADNWQPGQITLSAFGVFAAPESVLWLAPVPDASLLMAHRALSRTLEPLTIEENYRPGRWMPHVTLAEGLKHDQVNAAMDILAPQFKPIMAKPDRVEVVPFPPDRVIWSAGLSLI